MVQLHRESEHVHAAGADLHVIGNGAPSFIAGFRDTTGYDGPLYTDPSLETFRAAELRHGLRTVLSLATAVRTVGALRRGFRQGRTQGSALQQGGVLVISREGRVVWHQISDGPGDNASAAQIVSALRVAA
ncbi:MAG: peroxiredoxin-like family protein [Deltaproteobacteria bacterium]